MAKAIVVDQGWGLDKLRVVEREIGEPGPTEVLLEMRAVSLNRRDLMLVEGIYNPKQKQPIVPCSDGVGVVVAVGERVRRVKPGDRVCPIFAQAWIAGEGTIERIRSTLGGPLDGTLRERMLLDAEAVVLAPKHLDDREAAALPCAAVTAWSALVTLGALVAGASVVVQGSGGVSIFALQIAKLLGARVIATTSSEAKVERLTALGADHVICTASKPTWGDAARELAGGAGVDHVIEVGGAGTLAQSLRAVRPGGTVSIIGVLGGPTTEIDLRPVLMRNVRLQGVFVGHRESFEALVRALEAAKSRPVLDRSFAFADARAAFEHMASGTQLGKITIDVA